MQGGAAVTVPGVRIGFGFKNLGHQGFVALVGSFMQCVFRIAGRDFIVKADRRRFGRRGLCLSSGRRAVAGGKEKESDG